MAEEESFENLDDLDWSDVESELKANRDQILSEAKSADSGGQKEGDNGDESGKENGEGSTSKTLNRRVILTSIFCLMYSFPLL